MLPWTLTWIFTYKQHKTGYVEYFRQAELRHFGCQYVSLANTTNVNHLSTNPLLSIYLSFSSIIVCLQFQPREHSKYSFHYFFLGNPAAPTGLETETNEM